MGGYNSGRYGGQPTSEATGSFILDIAAFKRLGVLQRGILGELVSRFTGFAGDATVTIRLDLRHGENCYAELTHDTRSTDEEPKQIMYRVEKTATRPHFGGERWWFI